MTTAVRPATAPAAAIGQATPLLDVQGVSMVFGGLLALNNVHTRVWPGQIKAIIGPNGAGKTTLFNIITGIYSPTQGEVLFKGEPIQGLKPNLIAARGITRTFQTIRLFRGMTVLENVMVGLHRHTRSGFLHAALRLSLARREERWMHAQAMQILERMGLAPMADEEATNLPFGLQRVLEVARALATQPDLLILDEPASGLNESESRRLMDLLRSIRDEGTTILLVEHNMELVMELAEEILVLVYGTPIAEGPPDAIRSHPEVIAAYLGDEKLSAWLPIGRKT
jgi:ABC-type branched-subunit amino acid transport system ATPase component